MLLGYITVPIIVIIAVRAPCAEADPTRFTTELILNQMHKPNTNTQYYNLHLHLQKAANAHAK